MVLFCWNFPFPFRRNSSVFGASWPQRANLWNAETSQTDAIFAHTNSSFLHLKRERPLPQISAGRQCKAIKRTELGGALWKAAGTKLSGIKTPIAECVSGSRLPSLLCRRRRCGSCPGVLCLEWMEGTNFTQCELMLFFPPISCFFISPDFCPTGLR